MSKTERWIDLSELPKRGKFINWINSIGYKCKFKYGNIEGEIEILDYVKEKHILTIKYLDYNLFKIKTGGFTNCQFGKLLKKKTDEFKVEIRQVFKDNKRDLTIIDREYRKDKNWVNRKWYKYHCNKCNNEDWIEESHLLNNKGCNICCVKPKTKLGINTIYDTDKWMINLGVSEEDAKKYSHGSGQKIKVKCPDCGKEKCITFNTIYKNKTIFCSCGDGISYPEKFIISLLDQLNINYITQYSPNWSNKKKYDFYFELEDNKYIIETHGEQHYKNNTGYMKDLKLQQENDQYKKELALKNGINTYIELDCRESNIEWIKNSIINSKLNKIFDLSNINWLECESFALSNLVKEVCDYWYLHNEINNEGLTTKDLGKIFNLNCNTIIKYLKQGNKLGWCNYDVKEEHLKGSIKGGELNGNKVEIFKYGKSLGVFKSCHELERQSEKLFGIKLNQSAISLVANGKRKHHKGFTFKYITQEEYNKYINNKEGDIVCQLV